MRATKEQYFICQCPNTKDISIYEDHHLIFHAMFDKALTEEQLLEYLDSTLDFLTMLREGKFI